MQFIQVQRLMSLSLALYLSLLLLSFIHLLQNAIPIRPTTYCSALENVVDAAVEN